MAERKESNFPSYIAKDDDEHYRIEIALAVSVLTISVSKLKRGADNRGKKEEAMGDTMEKYIHRGIAQRAFSKMFRLCRIYESR